ncbi:MAG: L-fucose mutarotase [Oscillospiraceae bacterium]|nr:L-fucose mutarotase [Oscillospiraceae bacterium]
MLKGISNLISPELLKILMEMGHGDEIVLGDGNFPAAACARRLVRADGHAIPALLDAVLELFPLDEYVDNPVALMAVVPGDNSPTPEIWQTYEKLLSKHGQKPNQIEYMDRFDFYQRTKNAFAVVATGESAIYANILLKKGVIK